MAGSIYTSILNVFIQRTCSSLGQTLLIHQYKTYLYRGRALLQGKQYLYINIKRSYIEDVLSFRVNSIYTSILNVVIQRTCSPLGQAGFLHQYQTQLYRGQDLLQGRQYLYINIKCSYIEDVLFFRADSIDTSIFNVVIQRTCSPLGQAVFIH